MSETVVKIDATCSRTGKTETIEIPLSQAEKFHDIRKQRETSAIALTKSLNEVPSEKMPDLIVVYKGQMSIRPNVNPKSDAALARLLHDVTRDETAFPKPTANKRKSKETAVEDNPTSPELAESATLA